MNTLASDDWANSGLRLDLEVGFGAFELKLDHQFSPHGIAVLFGPSGSGKTTLLRVIAGLERRAIGEVNFGDQRWQSMDGRFVPPHQRAVGYVFQDARLFPHLDVAGNLGYADRRSARVRVLAAKDGPGDRGRRIDRDDVIQALDLEGLLSRRPVSLSGGERQRVAVGRALLSRPRLLLMDEPLAALDANRKADILPYLEKLPGTFGTPIIYVTHSIPEVARLADHMVVIADGRKVAQGSVQDVFERLDLGPAMGRFEAGVVLDAVVVGHEHKYQLTRLDHHGQQMVIPMVDAPQGATLRLRVRARDVALATVRPRGISVRNILEGTVIEIAGEAQTAFAEVLVDIRGARLRARVTRDAVDALALQPGSPVFALVKSIAFDRRSVSALADSGVDSV